ncbi:hypothetical protein LG208_00015 [Bacillus paralicheniformis]|uniref:hypothetical protein n=1 Tax=Bacillus paralicheniformis TaxID=1648923 RepID=UPI00227AAB54|nr:hypothetical protein [Bacillus paralicheniformis]MCY1628281.1 hypothetical protein [Bacillus paralicheniformis]
MEKVNLEEWLAQEKVQESIKEKIEEIESHDIQVYHEDFASAAEIISAIPNEIESDNPTIIRIEKDEDDTEIEFSVDIEYELEISAEELNGDSSPIDSETKGYAWKNYDTNTYSDTLSLPTTIYATITDNENYYITHIKINNGKSITDFKKPSNL